MDEEIGAFDAELPTDMMEGHFTSEQIARSRVSGKEPDRLNLRALLDSVFGSSARQESVDDSNGNVDVQSVRRLIGALVNRVARHTKHGVGKPVLGVHACARGKEGCEFCRYGFPHTCFGRNGVRKMMLEKGEREGQWHAKFPRNDRLCCSYDPHILLANMGNIDWRPVLNLWAVVQYVTKYATKAPKGSRKLQEVLKDAVDEVCTYVPEGDNADYLRRSIRKFFARTLGERDYHAYEAVQLGLQLPLVIPLMPIVSLNTSGARPLKKREELKTAGDDAPTHYDSRCDKFDKRLEMVKKQRVAGYKEVSEEEIRDVSMYEFYWKYIVYRGRVKPAPSQVCLMVTPSYSADCANVEHHCHNSYARSVVIAFWRHMSKADRDLVNHKSMESGGEKNRPPTVYGRHKFQTTVRWPLPRRV